MAFLAPAMLWGTLAAAIPIALHFFYRSRYRTVPWAAMKFLLTSIEQTSRRLRFQELLLLALRVALLLLLALALARPSANLARGGGGGDAVDAVLIVDTSLSMAARDGSPPLGDASDPYRQALRKLHGADGSVTRMDRAKAAAVTVLANLPPSSTVQIITATDRATLLGPEVPSHLDQAQTIIEGLHATHLSTDFLPAVSEAAAILQRGNWPNKELYFFSDMQKLGWEKQGAALREKVQEIRGFAAVHLVHCATRTPPNVSVIGLTPLSGLVTGEHADFVVLLRNSGKEAAHHLTVALEVDGPMRQGRLKSQQELTPEEKARRDTKRSTSWRRGKRARCC